MGVIGIFVSMRKFKHFELREMKMIHVYVNVIRSIVVNHLMYLYNIQFIEKKCSNVESVKDWFCLRRLFRLQTHGRKSTHIEYVDLWR